MRIVANRAEYKPTWLHTEVLDRIWKATGSPFVSTWTGLPVFPDWFEYEDGNLAAFKTADMNFEVVSGVGRIYFLDGRHRTRWLMSRFTLVPVGLEEQHYSEAVSFGLASRRVVATDSFPTFDYRGLNPNPNAR
jgi:hypothetical protein